MNQCQQGHLQAWEGRLRESLATVPGQRHPGLGPVLEALYQVRLRQLVIPDGPISPVVAPIQRSRLPRHDQGRFAYYADGGIRQIVALCKVFSECPKTSTVSAAACDCRRPGRTARILDNRVQRPLDIQVK